MMTAVSSGATVISACMACLASGGKSGCNVVESMMSSGSSSITVAVKVGSSISCVMAAASSASSAATTRSYTVVSISPSTYTYEVMSTCVPCERLSAWSVAVLKASSVSVKFCVASSRRRRLDVTLSASAVKFL